MEIKTIFLLQPLVVEYEENNQTKEIIILVDAARDKIYQFNENIPDELLQQVKGIVTSKKTNQKNSSKEEVKILESASKKQQSANQIISNKKI